MNTENLYSSKKVVTYQTKKRKVNIEFMIAKDDWRLQGNTDNFLNLSWLWKAWNPVYAQQNHANCEYCFSKFMDSFDSDVLHEGYTDLNDRKWICKTCFDDFRDMFQWQEQP